MKKRTAAVLAFIAVLLCLYGCDSILDGEKLTVTPHQEPIATPSDSVIEVGTFDELKTEMLGFVSNYEESGRIRAYNYDGNIQEDVDLACSQIMNDSPVGAYAVANMTGSSTKIVSHFQIEISISYKVTKKQLNDIIPASTTRYLKSELQDTLSSYERSMTVQTKNIVLPETDAASYVSEIYYANPRDIVMMPVTSVEIFPDHGLNRIIVFTFGYTKYEAITLRTMEINLNRTVRKIAESVGGNNDGEILLALAERLMEITDYDTETASGGDYSNQNNAATAYGALVNAQAVGEGYAMAYKALCDELSIECYVVLGILNGNQHAWNIVELEGHYYHIDVSMCDTTGISSAFLLNDTDMEKTYSWEKSKHKPCNGPLVYTSNGEIISTDANENTSNS